MWNVDIELNLTTETVVAGSPCRTAVCRSEHSVRDVLRLLQRTQHPEHPRLPRWHLSGHLYRAQRMRRQWRPAPISMHRSRRAMVPEPVKLRADETIGRRQCSGCQRAATADCRSWIEKESRLAVVQGWESFTTWSSIFPRPFTTCAPWRTRQCRTEKDRRMAPYTRG